MLTSYVLQAGGFVGTDEPFCENEGCRLFNAHYQADLVRAQLQDPEFCEGHAERYD